MTKDRPSGQHRVHLAHVEPASRQDPCQRITARPPPFPGILPPDRLNGDIVIREEIAKKIAESGDLRIIFAKEGHVDPKLVSVIAKTINASVIKGRKYARDGFEAPQTRRAQNALAKFDNVLAAKTILNTTIAIDDKDSGRLLGALAKCLDDGDYHIRLHAILGYVVHAARGGEIYEYLGLLSQRLDDVTPIIREVASLSLKVYAAQGWLQAHNALEASGSAKNTEWSASIRASAERTIEADAIEEPPMVQTAESEVGEPAPDSQATPLVRPSVHAIRMRILKDNLIGPDFDSSFEAFSQLVSYVYESESNAQEVLDLLKDSMSNDDLVLELIDTCKKQGAR